MPDTPVRSLSVRRRRAKPAQASDRKFAGKKFPGKRKAKAVLDKPAPPPGWDTSDDQEIALAVARAHGNPVGQGA